VQTTSSLQIDEFWAVARQVASEHGGLVVGITGDDQPELGSTLDSVLGFQTPVPVTVTAVAEWDDWKQQADAFHRLRPSWGRGHPGDPSARYYRVKLADQNAMSAAWSGSAARNSSLSTPEPAAPSFGGYATVTGGLPGASFAPRALARIADLVLHFITGFVAGRMFRFMILFSSGGHPPLWALIHLSRGRLFIYLGSILGHFCYQVVSTTICGSSLGKRMLSLQVLQENGSPCGLRSALIRELAYFIDSLFFGLIGYAAMRGDDQQQRYGDEWAGTIVCHMSDVPHKSLQSGTRFLLALTAGMAADMAFLLTGLLVQMLA
jgi:uncharacterized RDD family membrane protein YckC